MKTWAWLMVLPYVVSVSSGLYELRFKTTPDDQDQFSYYSTNLVISCHSGKGSDCAWILDFAEAINAGHERRLLPSSIKKESACVKYGPGKAERCEEIK